jgi:hypothetical protein
MPDTPISLYGGFIVTKCMGKDCDQYVAIPSLVATPPAPAFPMLICRAHVSQAIKLLCLERWGQSKTNLHPALFLGHILQRPWHRVEKCLKYLTRQA